MFGKWFWKKDKDLLWVTVWTWLTVMGLVLLTTVGTWVLLAMICCWGCWGRAAKGGLVRAGPAGVMGGSWMAILVGGIFPCDLASAWAFNNWSFTCCWILWSWSLDRLAPWIPWRTIRGPWGVWMSWAVTWVGCPWATGVGGFDLMAVGGKGSEGNLTLLGMTLATGSCCWGWGGSAA